MEANKSPLQLNMAFQGGNPLASRLRDGHFVVLIEYDAPLREQPFESALELGVRLAKRAQNYEEIAGLAVTDRLHDEDTHDPVDVANALSQAAEKPVLMHISGKGSAAERARDLVARATSNGIFNILAVTGNRSEKHGERRNHAKPSSYPAGYLDSVNILDIARHSSTRLHLGATINPFKYIPADQYLQYFKALRKLASGADFLVAQAGWDMKKMQELQWYLQMRQVDIPVIARLRLLNIQDISHIHDLIYPGVEVAKPFAAMLQRESNINATQSLAAQLQRLALQIYGCKVLGYSGVQLAGVTDENILGMVMSKVREVLSQKRSYAEWLDEWKAFHNYVDFSPRPNAYYGYTNLLSPECQNYSPEHCELTECTWPPPVLADRFRSWTLSRIMSKNTPAMFKELVGKVYCRNRNESLSVLKNCYYLCSTACPKNLVYGACGGTYADGTCEFGHKPCFFHRVIALGAHRHELDQLEESIAND